MKCKDVQDKLLLGETGDEMKEHIKNCTDCSEFSKIVAGMHDVTIPGPSAELDAKVLDFARNNRPSNKQPIPFYVFTAVAALLIITFSIMLLSKKEVNDSGESDIAKNPPKEKTIDTAPNKEMIANVNTQEESDLDQVLDNLWEDDVMSADIAAIEGELFVLSAELYSN